MYRENNEVGVRLAPENTYCNPIYKRTKRSREDIKDDIFNKHNRIATLKRMINRDDVKPENMQTMRKNLKKLQHELDKLEAELYEKDHSNIQHKRLRTRGKKQNLEKLEIKVTTIIQELKSKEINHVTKEDMAYWLNARVSQIELIFMRLNQKGILSQPVHRAMHDSQRDPWGYAGSSDWCSDSYYIR